MPRDEAGIRAWLVDELVRVGCDSEAVDVDTSFNDLGLGSRDSVVLAGELSELVGRQISPVDFWDHPTIATLAAFIANPVEAHSVPADAPELQHSDDAVAVIGLGCRFPGGVAGPESYWKFLLDYGNGVSTVPEGRWAHFDDGRNETVNALNRTTRWGGYLSAVDGFDAEYFDISPSEADKMDPQQRLLLEVTQEALDHAGIPADALRHSQTGVFAGSCAGEYGSLATRDLSQVDAWSGTGGALSIISNRLSYHYDLRGPSVTIDTACSSSLVAIHLACQSLRSGESSLALAAGVNVMLSPAITRSFDTAEAMSRSGQCHSFDAAADGYVRGEGAGVVILKRLADAVRDGDNVMAVVRGSAVNQDGRSNGLMAPNPSAQMSVLRSAYAAAGCAPLDVDYVETHGTGTVLGDPIEARALGTVLGRGRSAVDPLLIGAVKSNIGHLEAAAGVAGFIKAVLAVERGTIPANLGFSQSNPHINMDQLRLQVVAQHTAWPQRDRARRAGVSSFGFGGTNAHVVLEQAPPADVTAERTVTVPPAVTTLTVSAKSAARVRTQARALAQWLEAAAPDVTLADVAHTLDHHRTRHAMFATIAARERRQAITALNALAAGDKAPGLVDVHQGRCTPGTVFVYSGQGSQWAGMARSLLESEPEFVAALDEIEPDFVAQVGFSLVDVVRTGEPVVGISRIQPVLTGLQLALTRLWRSHGVIPDTVIGHSMGEVAAAVVSGALSVADGLKVIATRSRLMSKLAGQGAMALVELDADAAEALLVAYPDVTIAVHASPRQTVIAGPPDQVDAVIATVAADGRLARRVEVDVASHHPIIDPVLPDLRNELADLTPRRPHMHLITTTLADGEPTFDADYWCANLRNPVRFSQAISSAGAEHGVFVEISPHPILTYAIDDTLADVHHHSVATLQRDGDDAVVFHTNLNAARTTSPPTSQHGDEPHPRLPVTTWHHSSHWIELPERTAAAGLAPVDGTLLGERIDVADNTGTYLYRAELSTRSKPYPGSHELNGLEVVPVSVLFATLVGAARDAGLGGIGDVRLEYPVAVGRPRLVQVLVTGDQVSISSRSSSDSSTWVRHATARTVAEPEAVVVSEPGDLTPVAVAENRSTGELLREWGVTDQPFEWTFSDLRGSSDRLSAQVSLPEPSVTAVLDATAHLARLIDDSNHDLMIPSSSESVWLAEQFADTTAFVDIRRNATTDDGLVVDVTASSARGRVVDIRGLRFAPVDRTVDPDADMPPESMTHVLEWQPSDTDGDVIVTGAVAVLGDGARLAAALRTAGVVTTDVVSSADHIVFVGSESTGDHATDAVRMGSEVTGLVQRLADEDGSTTLWIVTQGVRTPTAPTNLAGSALWGLATVIAEEHPDIWGGLVDLPADADLAASAPALARVLGTPFKAIASLIDGRLFLPKPVLSQATPAREPLRCRPDAAYLVTGGFGAIGLVLADWLADHGARRIILAGRSALPPRRTWSDRSVDASVRCRIDRIRALEARGVAVEPVALDIADTAELRDFLTRRDNAGAPEIRGVIHAAGVTENRLLVDTDAEVLRTVMRPKIAGAQSLSQVFADVDLDFFHLTGSAGALFGIPGQGGYAAANAYLDALARFEHRSNRRTLSIDWVAWQDLGFGDGAAIVLAELERVGSRPVRTSEALAAWEYIHRCDVAQAVVLPRTDMTVPDTVDEMSTHAWGQMSRAEMLTTLENGLRAILAHELRIPEAELDSDVPFAEVGLNSVMAMSIRRDAEKLAGTELSATMLWNHPTIAALALHLADKIAPQDTATPDESLGTDSEGLLESLFDDVESSPLGVEPGL